MDITPTLTETRQLIQRYGGGEFVIAGETHTGSVVIFPEQTHPWPVTAFEQIDEASLATVTEHQDVEILLIGSGEAQQFFPPVLRDTLRQKYGVVVECMDTGAACRTFNILMSEDRKVAAALISV